MPTWSPGPTPWAARWWASRFARSSISLYVRRLPSQTTYSRSPKWSAAFSKRSARLNSTPPRLEHVLIGRQRSAPLRAGLSELLAGRPDGVGDLCSTLAHGSLIAGGRVPRGLVFELGVQRRSEQDGERHQVQPQQHDDDGTERAVGLVVVPE